MAEFGVGKLSIAVKRARTFFLLFAVRLQTDSFPRAGSCLGPSTPEPQHPTPFPTFPLTNNLLFAILHCHMNRKDLGRMRLSLFPSTLMRGFPAIPLPINTYAKQGGGGYPPSGHALLSKERPSPISAHEKYVISRPRTSNSPEKLFLCAAFQSDKTKGDGLI